MEDYQLPSPAGTQLLVDVRGAEIVSSSSEDPEVYLPHHEEMISHIALDIGGSLAKVVYFTRAPPSKPQKVSSSSSASPFIESPTPSNPSSPEPQPSTSSPFPNRRTPSPPSSEPAKPNGILGPRSLSQQHISTIPSSSASPSRSSQKNRSSAYPPFQSHLRRRSSASRIPPGGRLNFIKFETSKLTALINFLQTLITSSAASNRVPLDVMKKNVKIMATGGGAHKFYERLKRELGVEVRREEEMECLVLGLGFVMEVPNEVFWYSDELVQAISHPQERALSSVNVPSTPGRSATPLPIPPPSPPPSEVTTFPPSTLDPSSSTTTLPSTSATHPNPRPISPTPSIEDLPRPSPNPPQYSISFDSNPTPAQFPCLLVNIGSGVSIIKIDDYGKFERISGTSLGGGTLWGLLSLLTGAKSFDDMLALADRGDNSSVDMLVGDIYGQDYQKIGLKSSTIASSFGKVFRKGEGGGGDDDDEEGDEEEEEERKKSFKPEDISRSLLYAISNNIGQIAYMNAEKHNLDRIYFGGGFIRGHAATISTLSYAIRFWSKGTKRALFLRHEGYLGGIGAWLKNLEPATPSQPQPGSTPSTGTNERGREGAPASGLEEKTGKLSLTEVDGVEIGLKET
ncbi:pantothenate kinase [Sporobolomyces salmoneus]|uniref:pantothenate kinase n=1 Tax=Sporobolomyces salmoneus TaxID=183962 RepID=UPI003175B200